MPTLRAGDERALGTPAGRNKIDTNKDTLKNPNTAIRRKLFTDIYMTGDGEGLVHLRFKIMLSKNSNEMKEECK